MRGRGEPAARWNAGKDSRDAHANGYARNRRRDVTSQGMIISLRPGGTGDGDARGLIGMTREQGGATQKVAGQSWFRVAGALVLMSVLAAGCSSKSDSTAPAGGLIVLPTQGTETDGQLAYSWNQDYTSPNETPSLYTILVTKGWQPKEASADSIAKYIADDADESSGDLAPVSLTITCGPSGAALAKGTYIRNDGGAPDITWRSYTETAASC